MYFNHDVIILIMLSSIKFIYRICLAEFSWPLGEKVNLLRLAVPNDAIIAVIRFIHLLLTLTDRSSRSFAVDPHTSTFTIFTNRWARLMCAPCSTEKHQIGAFGVLVPARSGERKPLGRLSTEQNPCAQDSLGISWTPQSLLKNDLAKSEIQ